MLTVAQAAKRLGVHPDTIRRMPESALPGHRTNGGHRRYLEKDVDKLLGKPIEPDSGKENVAVIYSRVSSQDQKQKGDLDRQKLRNMEYCIANGLTIAATFEECSSGLNDNRKKLKQLIDMASRGEFKKLVIEHRERLTRFNFNLFEYFFSKLGIEIIYVEEQLPKSFETALVEDILHLLAVFSAKLYGKRSHKNKAKNEAIANG